MSVQSERLPNRPAFFRKSLYVGGLHFLPQPMPVEKKNTSSVREYLGQLIGKLSLSLGAVLLMVLGVVLCGIYLTGFIRGKLSPEYTVTVQPFEILPDVGNHGSISSKSASDIVVDIVNDTARHAAQFHGTGYYKYMGAGAQPVSLHESIKIPIQTSYGIDLKGISLDGAMHLYDKARYDQWTISGDVVSSPDGLVGRIRLNTANAAKSWETPPSAHADPSRLVRDATYLMLAEQTPELLGQSYLQQANYDAAEKIFRQWAINDPQNWKSSYYLSLVYSYEDKGREASSLANWSRNIAGMETKKSSRRRIATGSEKEVAADLAQTTRIALQTSDASDTQTLNALQQTLNALGENRSGVDRLLRRRPANADYRIQRARVLDKEALIEAEQNSPHACERSLQAIESLDAAIESAPENGGLHEQRAILLMHLVTTMKKQNKDAKDIRKKEIKEVEEYIRAIELSPKEDSALWGAIYAQIDLGNNEDAIELARVITLLRPDSKAASAAYIFALASAIKTPWKEPGREKELKDRIRRLVKANPDESQLSVIWDALMLNNDREALDLVETGARRLFPDSSNFKQRKLQSYMVHLLAYDGSSPS